MQLAKHALILLTPLLLASCLLTPGKFNAALDVRADRSFTFTYRGEAILTDPSDELSRSASEATKSEEKNGGQGEVKKAELASKEESSEQLVKRRAIAEALEKEVGYRSVRYTGNGHFEMDYAISGRLDRTFVFPFNSDASAILPWVAIEIRKNGTVRMQAPGFGEEDSSALGAGRPSKGKANAERQGTFTVTTDAELVMHNNEEGLAPGGGSKVIWQITPTTKAIPTAVFRFRS